MSEIEIIHNLEGYGDEYSKCRAHHAKKRSGKFKRKNVREYIRRKNGKFTLSDYPLKPLEVRIFLRYEITTFVVHGREIVWTGARQDKPPIYVWAEYVKLC